VKPWEVVFLSGKGGAGKTTTVKLVSEELELPHVLADADVEGANLHIGLGKSRVLHEFTYEGSEKAEIDREVCVGCGECVENCEAGALELRDGRAVVREVLCEGCGLCSIICPLSAVRLVKRGSGVVRTVETEEGKVVVYGELNPGEANSGKLVSTVKAVAMSHALSRGMGLVLVDGPPGVGCPAISSLSGADGLVLVAEATPYGIHDARRVLVLSEKFRTLKFRMLVLNKWHEGAPELEREGFNAVVRLPYSFKVEEHLRRNSPLPREISERYRKVAETLKEVLIDAGWSAGSGKGR
jgi:MinD superfamily P-loop ATPase